MGHILPLKYNAVPHFENFCQNTSYIIKFNVTKIPQMKDIHRQLLFLSNTI